MFLSRSFFGSALLGGKRSSVEGADIICDMNPWVVKA